MINISKQEAAAIRQRFGDNVVTMVNRKKKSNRKRYLISEEARYIFYLAELRAQGGVRIG